MSHPEYSDEEIARRGKRVYEERIRHRVELPENIGKIIAIDIETGEYDIEDDLLSAAEAVQSAHPGAAVWGERIGYDAVFALGAGSIERRKD